MWFIYYCSWEEVSPPLPPPPTSLPDFVVTHSPYPFLIHSPFLSPSPILPQPVLWDPHPCPIHVLTHLTSLPLPHLPTFPPPSSPSLPPSSSPALPFSPLLCQLSSFAVLTHTASPHYPHPLSLPHLLSFLPRPHPKRVVKYHCTDTDSIHRSSSLSL